MPTSRKRKGADTRAPSERAPAITDGRRLRSLRQRESILAAIARALVEPDVALTSETHSSPRRDVLGRATKLTRQV